MFSKMKQRKRMQQTYDRDNITMKRCGKEINMYDYIQAGREDTEIYDVLEKYGCIDKIKINTEAVYLDVTELQKMQGLRGIADLHRRAEEIFENLPIEVRKEFNNSVNEFTKRGPKWIEEKYAEEKALKQKEQTEENANEQE